MGRILAKRALSLVFVLFSVTFLTFIVANQAPGDPILNMMGGRQDPVRYQFLLHLYGLDQPWYVQYVTYITHLLQGTLGYSFKYSERPVWDLIACGVPVGARRPIEPRTVSSGNPNTAAAGRSGAATSRFGLVTARMRSRPDRWSSST